MSPTKVFSGSVVVFCTLLLFFVLADRTYAANPDQKMTTTGQILTIQISDTVTLAPGGLITLTGRATLSSSQWLTLPVGANSTSIDLVEVHVEQGAPVIATLDALGNWSVVITDCTIPTKMEATVFAKDGTRVMADFTLCGPLDMPALPAPTPSVQLDKFIFLPIISAE